MEHLADITLEDLQGALERVDGSKPTLRLAAAVAYKNGVSQTEIGEWYGVQRRTVYNWLERLDAEALEEAVTDDHRSGRPRKLDDDQLRTFRRTVREPPSAAGYDASAWTPTLVQQYLDEAFDAAYSRPSCRRLMKEAGLQYRTPARPATGETDDGATGDDGDVGGRWVSP